LPQISLGKRACTRDRTAEALADDVLEVACGHRATTRMEFPWSAPHRLGQRLACAASSCRTQIGHFYTCNRILQDLQSVGQHVASQSTATAIADSNLLPLGWHAHRAALGGCDRWSEFNRALHAVSNENIRIPIGLGKILYLAPDPVRL